MQNVSVMPGQADRQTNLSLHIRWTRGLQIADVNTLLCVFVCAD